MKLNDGVTWLKQQVSGVGAEFVRHDGRVDPTAVGHRIGTWLVEARGFETRVIPADRTCLVEAEAVVGWRKTIGANPCLAVHVSTAATGTEVDVRPGRVGDAVWTACDFTNSLIAWDFGVSFVTLRRDLLQFVRQELQDLGGITRGQHVLDIVEATRSEQSLGRDERVIDNLASDATLTRSIRATKRWRQSYTLEIENSRSSGRSIELNLAHVAALRSNLEETLRRHYMLSTEEEQTFEEEVTLQVPAQTSLRFIIEWKRIVQEGYVRMRDPVGRTIQIPFAMTVGVTFDQRQSDLRSPDRQVTVPIPVHRQRIDHEQLGVRRTQRRDQSSRPVSVANDEPVGMLVRNVR
ncbi:MAG TPA: hypothetical protein VIW24_14940 [Aldersonia sp.]